MGDVLVTGAPDNVGSSVVSNLLAAGNAVVAVASDPKLPFGGITRSGFGSEWLISGFVSSAITRRW